MLGLVLEGGGAKGSFHVGALKALFERGYKFDAVMGTSVGALNGVLVAQNDFDKLYAIWQEITPSTFFDVDDERVSELINKSWSRETIKYFIKFLRGTIANRGISAQKLHAFAASLIDEDKLRASDIDFGVVTVSLSDDWMPVEIFKDEMAEGTVSDYVLASAYFPAFKINPLGGKKYIDGGIYDNLPINPLIRKGYKNIIAIRTNSNMPHRRVIDKSVKVDYIIPSESLGKTLSFTKETISFNINLGYYDALRYIDSLAGKKYYIYPFVGGEFEKYMSGLGYSEEELYRLMHLIDKMTTDSFSVFEAFLKMLEVYALSYKIPRFKVYTFEEFVMSLVESYKENGSASVIGVKEEIGRFFYDFLERYKGRD